MSNVGDVRTKGELFRDALMQNSMPGILRYQGICIGDGSPAFVELFLNGENGHRLVLPTDSYIFGLFIGAAWNETDGDVPTGTVIYFGLENDGGTVAAPAFGTGTNLAGVAIGESGGLFAIAADDTNKAVSVRFTATANDTYKVFGTMYYSFAGANMLTPNMYSQTN